MPAAQDAGQRGPRSTIVAIGEDTLVGGLAFAGVHAVAANHPDAVRRAWRALPDDVGLVILTSMAHAALEGGGVVFDRGERLWAVMPE